MADNDVDDEDEAATIVMLIDETLSSNQLCSHVVCIYKMCIGISMTYNVALAT